MISPISISAFWDELEKISAMVTVPIKGVSKMIRRAVPVAKPPPIPSGVTVARRGGVGVVGNPASWKPAIPEYAR